MTGTDSNINWPQLPSYTGKVERLEVKRYYEDAEAAAKMLRSFGFDVAVEIHCGFWLVHWRWPQLRKV